MPFRIINLKKPLFFSNKIDYICFTDRKNLKSKIWKIKYIEPIYYEGDTYCEQLLNWEELMDKEDKAQQ